MLGSMLLFFGVYQVVAESRVSTQKKLQDRLRGTRCRRRDPTRPYSAAAMGQAATFADALVGRFSFVPRLQTLLDQAGFDWSASQTLMNLSGRSGAFGVGIVVAGEGDGSRRWVRRSGVCAPLLWINFRRKSRMTKLSNQLPDVFEMMGQAAARGAIAGGTIQLVYEQMPPPIATEFRAGLPRAEPRHSRGGRVAVDGQPGGLTGRAAFFVTAVMIQRPDRRRSCGSTGQHQRGDPGTN